MIPSLEKAFPGEVKSMPSLGDRLDSILVAASSPDKQIDAILNSRNEVRLSFPGNSFTHYTGTQSLSYQLSQLLNVLWAIYTQARRDTLTDAGFELFSDTNPHWDRSARELREAVAATKAAGTSADNSVAVATIGLSSFQVRLSTTAIRDVAEADFCQQFHQAVTTMVANYKTRVRQAREQAHSHPMPVSSGEPT